MTAAEYMAALYGAGIPRNLPAGDFDRRAAALLRVEERTARRWRRGETAIPGPVEVALSLLATPNRGA